MNEKEVEEFAQYFTEMEFLGTDKRDAREVTRYAKSKGMNDTKCSRQMKEIRENKVKLILYDEGMLSVNTEQIYNLIEYLNPFINKKDTFNGPCITGDSVISVKTSSQELSKRITSLENKLTNANAENKKLVIENQKLKEKEAQAQNEINNLKQTIAALKVMPPVLVLDTQSISPCESDKEAMLVQGCNNKNQCTIKDAVMDESTVEFTVESTDGVADATDGKTNKLKVLNEENYLRRKIQKIFSKKFLNRKVERVLEKGDKKEFVSDKVYVNTLLSDGYYTNQEKLALYAAFSDYRHTDFEKLLNFAGDNNIDADTTIKWAESLNDKVDYLQIKNALRQLAKPSEFKMKYELARELLLGVWEVEFNVNNEPTRFKLVSEKDINMVKKALGLPDTAFTYTCKEDDKAKEKYEGEKEEMVKKKEIVIKEKPAVAKKPDFVKNYNINDEFADYDLPQVAVAYEDVMEE